MFPGDDSSEKEKDTTKTNSTSNAGSDISGGGAGSKANRKTIIRTKGNVTQLVYEEDDLDEWVEEGQEGVDEGPNKEDDIDDYI
jgi:hypothetical protein